MKILLIILVLFIGCAPLTTSDIQSAKLVDKGQYELTPSTSVSLNSLYLGMQAAYGLSNDRNLRMRIERIKIKTDFDNDLADYNVSESLTHFSFGLKSSILKNKLAFYLPISFTFNDDLNAAVTFIEPTLFFSMSGKYLEFNPTLKILINQELILLDVINIGFGISSNMDKWVLRPELGCIGPISSAFNDCLPQASLGLSINLSN